MRLLLAALVLGALPGRAVVTPPEDPVDRELRLVKPALVRIESHAKATVSAATIDFDQGALESYARRDVANLLASGRRFPSITAAEQVITSDLEHEFVTNPGPYLKLGERVSDPYETARVGSGWLADGDGSVVTASDVLLDDPGVTAAATEQERNVISAALDDVTPADLGLTIPFNDAQKTNLVNAALARVVPSIQVSNVSSHTAVQLGWAAPGRLNGYQVLSDARIAVNTRSAHGIGLAVLQVPGHQFASVPLAYGSTLTSGQPVVVAGYPASAAEGDAVTQGPLAKPEAVGGTIGDAVPEGGSLTDTGFTAGGIGGAVLDGDGQALAVAVKHDGASAIAPVADVVRVLDQAHARGASNAVTKDYRKAAADMSRHWYKRALPILRTVVRKAPDMPWVPDQGQEASLAIREGRGESPNDPPF